MDKELDYPVAAPKDVAPVIYRAMIIQSMALQFFKYMQGSPEEFTMDEAFDAAKAVGRQNGPTIPRRARLNRPARL